MKKWTFSLVLVALFSITLCSFGATEYHIGRGQPGDYVSLKELHLAIEAGTIQFQNGDVLTLYRDDFSLALGDTGPFYLPSGVGVTIRSHNDSFCAISGGTMFTASHPFFILEDSTSHLTLDKGIMLDTFLGSSSIMEGKGGVSYVGAGTLQVKNATISNGYAVYGGAFAIDGGTATITDSSIRFNNAEEAGGAIDLGGGGVLNLKATEGNTLQFLGNSIRDIRNNRIDYVSINFSGDATLNVDVASGGIVDIQDERMTVTDDTAIIDIVKTGAGLWKQGGESNFTNASTNIDIREGTLELANSWIELDNPMSLWPAWVETYGQLNITNGNFTLQGLATLLSTEQNKISATNIILQSGSTLAFSLTDAIRTDASTPQTALTLEGILNLPALGTVSVDLWSQLPQTGGIYQLLDVSNTDKIISDSDFTYKLFGNKLTDLGMNERASEVKYEILGGQYLNVEIGDEMKNYEMTWTGQANNIWNMTDGNWTENTSGHDYTHFFGGDAVVFDNVLGGTIQIAQEGVLVGKVGDNFGMTVNSGNWNFRGGEIQGGVLMLNGTTAASTGMFFDSRLISQTLGVEVGKSGTFGAMHGEEVTLSGSNTESYAHIVVSEKAELVFGGQGMVTIANNSSMYDSGGAAVIGSEGTVRLVSGTNQFTENSTYSNGGVFFGSENAVFNIENGTNTFELNYAMSGGVIAFYVDGVMGGYMLSGTVNISNGTNTFQKNRAMELSLVPNTALGGVFLTDTVSISGGTNQFENNLCVGNGGVVYSNNITISGGTNTFRDNVARATDDPISGSGGVFAVEKTVIISGGTNLFQGNSAIVGGVMMGRTLQITGGKQTFQGNTAVEAGGAIYGSVIDIRGGSNNFLSNETGMFGGAIYVAEKLSLFATDADFVFQGNNQLVGSEYEGANAIFIGPGAEVVAIGAKSGQQVSFYDPIETSLTKLPWLCLNYDPQNPNESYTGTILFDRHQSTVNTDTILGAGTLALTGGAIYGAKIDTGNLGTFTAAYGSTIAFEIDGTDSSHILTGRYGSMQSPFSNGSAVVNVLPSVGTQGVVLDDFEGYLLIQSDTAQNFSDLSDFHLVGSRGGKITLDGVNFMLGYMEGDTSRKTLALVLYEQNPYYQNLGKTLNQSRMGAALDRLNLNYDPIENLNPMLERLLDMAEYNRGMNMRVMTGEMKANSFRLALSDPWTSAMDHISFTQPAEGQRLLNCSETTYAGQSRNSCRNFWATGIFANENMFADGNSDGFSLYRNGVAFGQETKCSNRLRRGFTFAYTDTSANQWQMSVAANDFQFGFYELRKIRNVWEGRGYIGMGLQGYDSRRTMTAVDELSNPTGLETAKGSYSGLSYAMKYELARLVYLSSSWTLLPLMSADYQGAWQSGFSETGSVAALSYDKSQFGLFRLGFGMDVRFFSGYNLSSTVRLRYFEHLGGDTPTAETRFAAGGDMESFLVNGTAIGRSYGLFGVGMKYDLCESNRLYLFGNYDLQTSHRSTSHYGTVGIGAKW